CASSYIATISLKSILQDISTDVSIFSLELSVFRFNRATVIIIIDFVLWSSHSRGTFRPTYSETHGGKNKTQ
ncbi:MAG TPA: hypothetical protein VJ695_11545, partial [Nitrososphaera sp.]|nr:hypothetical protein [Nitrososphaera sp.]